MKNYKLYLAFLLLASISFAGCNDEETYDNKAFNGIKTSTVLFKSNLATAERTIYAEIAQPENYDITINYGVNANLVSKYNNSYYDNAVLLPEKYYEFPEPRVTIQKGSVKSPETTIYFKDMSLLNRDTTYVLPVTITNITGNIGVLESARNVYYVVKGAAMINVVADIKNNYLYANSWANSAALSGLTQMTLEALFRARDFDNSSGISTIMGKEGHFLIRIGDAGFPKNQVQVVTPGGNFPSADASKGLPTSEWIHLAVTYTSGGSISIYVNGELQSNGSTRGGSVTFNTGLSGFCIGRSWDNNRPLNGEIAECRIWNVVRTQAEIAASPYEVDPDSPGLVAYWKFDEGQGSVISDHTTNGNNLTATKEITWNSVSLPAN